MSNILLWYSDGRAVDDDADDDDHYTTSWHPEEV